MQQPSTSGPRDSITYQVIIVKAVAMSFRKDKHERGVLSKGEIASRIPTQDYNTSFLKALEICVNNKWLDKVTGKQEVRSLLLKPRSPDVKLILRKPVYNVTEAGDSFYKALDFITFPDLRDVLKNLFNARDTDEIIKYLKKHSGKKRIPNPFYEFSALLFDI